MHNYPLSVFTIFIFLCSGVSALLFLCVSPGFSLHFSYLFIHASLMLQLPNPAPKHIPRSRFSSVQRNRIPLADSFFALTKEMSPPPISSTCWHACSFFLFVAIMESLFSLPLSLPLSLFVGLHYITCIVCSVQNPLAIWPRVQSQFYLYRIGSFFLCLFLSRPWFPILSLFLVILMRFYLHLLLRHWDIEIEYLGHWYWD